MRNEWEKGLGKWDGVYHFPRPIFQVPLISHFPFPLILGIS